MQEEVDVNIPQRHTDVARLRESRDDLKAKPATAYMQSPHDDPASRGRKIIRKSIKKRMGHRSNKFSPPAHAPSLIEKPKSKFQT